MTESQKPAGVTYTLGHSSSVTASHALRTAENSCGYLLPQLKPSSQILDVGCGPGSISASLAKHVPEGSVLGLDYSEDVVKQARSQANLPANCTFQTGSAMALPFPDETFDVVHAHQLLCHLSDPFTVIREMRRVCKSGGYVAFREGDLAASVVHPSAPELLEWTRITRTVMRESGGSEPDAGRRLIDWAMQGGFKPEDITYSVGSMTFAGDMAKHWSGNVSDRVRDLTFQNNAIKYAGLAPDQFEVIIKAWQEWGKQPGAVWSVLCGEALCRK